MRATCSLISTVILLFLAGQSQSAPILGLGSNDGLLGGLTHTANALPINGRPNNGLLGDLSGGGKLDGLLGGSQSGKLLTTTGSNGGNLLVSTHGPLGKTSLKRRWSLPLVGESDSSDAFETNIQPMASGLGFKLNGLLRKRDSTPSLNSAFSKVPGLGYFPGLGTLPVASTLPGIRNLPGLTLIPGFGSSTAPSGLGSTLIGASADVPPNRSIANLNARFSGILDGLGMVPGGTNTSL